jgi:UDP-N-acetylmuramoyl-L-alanyl-D-glutamate--2,6-diaminopimelate ligase
VVGITHDSRQVRAGWLFACLRGHNFDGHRFAEDAVAAGATALLVDHELSASGTVGTPQLVVEDTRLALGHVAAAVLGDPSDDLLTVGVTGTNGKTTTSQMIARILEADGRPTGLVGTLSGARTTPEAPELQRTLAEFVDAGDRAAVLEVSSHALALHRVDGTRFDAAVFTNLGRDHLDLHGTEEAYFRAKAMLFEPRFTDRAVINVEDRHGRLLADTLSDGTVEVDEFTTEELDDVEVGTARHRYRWRGQRVEVPLGGVFNVSNSLAALTTATAVGVAPELAAAALAELPAVPGRFEVVVDGADPAGPGFTVVVDYAHTPDGLEQLLGSARATTIGRTILVFGCGGERDEEKRPEMGAVASRLADQVIVTSDNPRREDPDRIIEEILAGVGEEHRVAVTTQPDRRAAIADAVGRARRGDVVLIAGKGHERTQDLGASTIEFDDRIVARELVEARS